MIQYFLKQLFCHLIILSIISFALIEFYLAENWIKNFS